MTSAATTAPSSPRFSTIWRIGACRERATIRQIVENRGEDGAVVAAEVIEAKDVNYGYNAATGEYGDMLKMGVLDPAKVVKNALSNAASIAGLMLTTSVLVTKVGEGDDKLPKVEGVIR